jgi:hypothetical protein
LYLAAFPADAGPTAPDIGGRWQGESYANEGGGKLTLDIVACGAGWCGIKVADNAACGDTALKWAADRRENNAQFEGTLQLAPGTEPYTVHATIFPPEEGKPLAMQITGDTGGQFRAYRRSFPFEAQMARLRDAIAHAPQTVSSLTDRGRHCFRRRSVYRGREGRRVDTAETRRRAEQPV